jgi:hypothetical protein
MVINILLILVMSDELERVFLGGRRMVSWDRTQIIAKTLEIIKCLKH